MCALNASYTFCDDAQVSRVKLLSALNQRERSIDIFSVVFIVTKETCFRCRFVELYYRFSTLIY